MFVDRLGRTLEQRLKNKGGKGGSQAKRDVNLSARNTPQDILGASP